MDTPKKDLVSQIADVERAYGGKPSWQREIETQNTKLAYEYWLVARTPDSKVEFGDWEARRGVERLSKLGALDLSQLEPLKNKAEIKERFKDFGVVHNYYDGRPVIFPSSISGKLEGHMGYDVKKIAGAFEKLFTRSVPINSLLEEERKGHKNHIRTIQGYHNYVGKFQQGRSQFYIRFTVQQTMGQEGIDGEGQCHSAFVSSVSVYDNSAEPPSSVWGQDNLVMTESSAGVTRYDWKLAEWLAAGKQKIAPNGKSIEAKEPTNDEVKLFLEHQRFRIPLGRVTLPLSSGSEKLIRIANTARKLRKYPNDSTEKRTTLEKFEQSLNSLISPGLTAIPLKRIAIAFSTGKCSENKLRDACLAHENAMARNLRLQRSPLLGRRKGPWN